MTSPEEIIGEVSCLTGVPAPAITGKRRTRSVVYSRHLVIATLRQRFPHFSLRELSEAVGRTDHATALNSIAQFDHLVATEPHFRALASQLQLVQP